MLLINKSFITLIPKSNNEESSNHCRPISLCNVYFKIIAKILANMVKPLLNKIVYPFQGVFALRRLMNDIMSLPYKIMH